MHLKNIAISAVFCSVLCAGFSVFAQGATGQTETTSFDVQLTVAASCTVTAGGDITFDDVTVSTNFPFSKSTNLLVTCSLDSPYSIGMQPGDRVEDGVGRMTSASEAGHAVNYSIFRDASLTQLWGDEDDTRYAGKGAGVVQDIPVTVAVMDRMDANVPPGTYRDTVTVAVYF